MKIKLDHVLMVLLTIYSLLMFSDGVAERDFTAILVMGGLCVVILLFSGTTKDKGLIDWVKTHSSQVIFLALGVGFVSVNGFWRYFTMHLPLAEVIKSILVSFFFFGACIAFTYSIRQKFPGIFGRSKDGGGEH